jgi:hypothetical protein
MPRNPDNRARLPSITAKISSIRGFSAEERDLFLRIGNLVDALAIAERSLANPSATSGKKVSERVPIPTGITTTGILDGVTVKWTAVDYSSFDSYEVQTSGSASFASSTSFSTTVNRISIRDDSASDLFIRVRTIGRQGLASEWAPTVTFPLVGIVFGADTDAIAPENRTTVNPQPELLGTSFNAFSGDVAVVGVGASVGPSPIRFVDTDHGGLFYPASQITYRLEENDNNRDLRIMGLPTMWDFFDNFSYTLNPAFIDVRFLSYTKEDEHEQAGIIVDASYFLIKA